VGDKSDAVAVWWESAITEIAPGSIRIRGYAIEDLIGRISFPAMIWLTLRGELPSARQSQLLGAVLVAGVDHGPQAPSIAIARMAITCGIGINAAMASAVNVLGDIHGGAGQQCMELLGGIDARCRAGAELDLATAEALDDWRARNGRHIPGFGHRFHSIDPRAARIAELMREAVRDGVIAGRFARIGEALTDILGRGKDSPPPMNVDGVTAVLLLELGFPAELGRGIFVLSRSVGICAHAFEQSQRGERLKGPIPPEAPVHYTGVGPRELARDETLP
jgi:citrate synthase